jgi:hypothetical protein
MTADPRNNGSKVRASLKAQVQHLHVKQAESGKDLWMRQNGSLAFGTWLQAMAYIHIFKKEYVS